MANMYQLYQVVEVVGSQEGLIGSYHPATIVDTLQMSGSYEVEYHLVDNPFYDIHDEIVPVSLLRPIPPVVVREKYDIGEHVDVFIGNLWWYGIVNFISEDGEYEIDFNSLNHDNVVVQYTSMRSHFEWNGSTYVSSN